MESIREQIEYGTRCVHGIPLGTPGGADLMCGLCEDGLTTWVDDPLYELTLDITSPTTGTVLTDLYQGVGWRASMLHDGPLWRDEVMRSIMRQVRKIDALGDQVSDRSTYVLTWYAKVSEPGYWA